ncbi:MAG: helix-turn-helix transcriptional regulator, partial [Clostridiaceae bacterium]|nr:helix-turn-helix transcriptional regulator [Clostridiaceae bacterium]
MKEDSLGKKISTLRKSRGMTQLELAEKMNVTDKAVSKWERDLSRPDIDSLPKLAEALGLSVDDLMRSHQKSLSPATRLGEIVRIILKA